MSIWIACLGEFAIAATLLRLSEPRAYRARGADHAGGLPLRLGGGDGPSPKWKIEAASTASAPPATAPSTRWARLPDPTAGDDRDAGGVDDLSRQLEVESSPGRQVHGVEHHLAGASPLALPPPRRWRRSPSPPGRRGCTPRNRVGRPAHVDADDHALGPERVGKLVDQVRQGHRRAVDADLVGPHPQQPAGVSEGAHPTPHG